VTLSTNPEGEYVASRSRSALQRHGREAGVQEGVAGPVQVNIQDRVGVDVKLEAARSRKSS